MKISNVRRWLESIGFDGVYRPSDDQIVAPIMQIPVTLNNTGTELVISGAGPSALWVGDSNLNTFMPQTGRFFIVAKAFQLVILDHSGVDEEEVGIAALAQQTVLRHSPLVGQKSYDYRASPGYTFASTITAVNAQEAPALFAQSPYQAGPQPLADDLAIDIANDRLELIFPTVDFAPDAIHARLDLYGFAISYDGRPVIEALIREGGPDAYLQNKADRKALPRLLASRVRKA